jgi:hypothetical protein
LIENEMLLVETDDTTSHRRIVCGTLCKKLKRMRKKCDTKPEYALKPARPGRGSSSKTVNNIHDGLGEKSRRG